MRDLKFKVWDKKNKEFIANGDAMNLYYSARCNAFMFDNDNYDLDGNVVFLQYTGLKDKNGKEIYEGDILDFDEREWGEAGFVSVVKWNENNACWVFDGGTPSDVKQWRTVIGNIYESPELLEVFL